MLEHVSVKSTQETEEGLNRRQRRKLRTRRRLKQATAELLVAHGYDGFTVTDITTRADLARGTFYVHFGDKEDVVWGILQDVFDELNAYFNRLEGDSDQRRLLKWRGMFAYVVRNRELLQVMMGENGHIRLVRRMQDYIAEVIVRDTEAGVSDPIAPVPVDVAAQFMAGAMLRVIDWWLAHPDTHTADEMADIFFTLVVRRPLPDVRDFESEA